MSHCTVPHSGVLTSLARNLSYRPPPTSHTIPTSPFGHPQLQWFCRSLLPLVLFLRAPRQPSSSPSLQWCSRYISVLRHTFFQRMSSFFRSLLISIIGSRICHCIRLKVIIIIFFFIRVSLVTYYFPFPTFYIIAYNQLWVKTQRRKNTRLAYMYIDSFFIYSFIYIVLIAWLIYS